MRALVATLETERNFRHVKAWKSYDVKKTIETAPEIEPPSAAAPVPA
jgi:hypothetical protein